MGTAEINWSALEDGDDDPDAMARWFLENDRRARQAMVEAGIWYGAGQRPPAPAADPFERVLAAVAAVTAIGAADLEGTSHQAHIVAARQVAFFILRNHCGLAHLRIAEKFGCHHTSVSRACRRVGTSRADFECWIGPALARIEGKQP